ncbi:MAG: hypothetical protein J5I59_13235 [Saprospiraceae bacterium]|nr:hypothetical protein [Saprospiraceae bacterium]
MKKINYLSYFNSLPKLYQVIISDIFKLKWIVLFFCIAIGVAGYFYAKMKPFIYPAKLTFMVNEDESSKLTGGLAVLLGRVGVGSSGKINLDKMIELSKSRNIIQSALLAKVKVNERTDYFVNHFINIYELNKTNKDGEEDVLFTHSNVDSFTIEENRMLIKTYNLLTGEKGILSTNYSEKSGIMEMALNSINEELSINFVDTLFQKLSEFYISKSIEKEYKTYSILKQKVSKLFAEMNQKEYSSARIEDQTLGEWRKTDNVPVVLNRRDANVLLMVYGEALKNLEIAEFSLNSKTPTIQIIDSPIKPIKPIVTSKTIYTAVGFMAGLLLSLVFIFIKNVLNSIH